MAMETTDANASRNDDLLMLFSLRVFGEVLPSCMESTESAWTGGGGFTVRAVPNGRATKRSENNTTNWGNCRQPFRFAHFLQDAPTHSRSVRISGLSLQSDGKRRHRQVCQHRSTLARQVDIIAGNNTDGLIPALDLFALEDDHHYFPRYGNAGEVARARHRSK